MQTYTTNLPAGRQMGPAPDASPGESPAPLGSHPGYDDALDAAVEYPFPASDPIACVQCCGSARGRDTAARYAEQGPPPGDPVEPAPSMKPGDEAPAGSVGTGEGVCPRCGGSGRADGRACPDCEGTGTVTVGIGGA